jgi:NADH-quinone oxidoreductase subunit G
MEMKKATIYVDEEPREVALGDGKNLLEVCLSLGYDLPYFCWHPALHSVGACRQCAVKLFKDENDKRGRIVMSCMTAVVDGMRISIEDKEAREARKGVIELLMVNHPHDCPVCDEGGECHLQDMTVMTGHDYRRYRFTKRTHANQNLGPFLNHEMNRCIQCYRCVRFYRDYAGGRDFSVQGWHDHVYFGRHSDGPLENEFSGNLCEVCPTGVFTDKTYKAHYARKWDLRTAPSICAHCAVGCDTSPGEANGTIRRVQPRYNSAVNGYFLCDRGRFGYEYADAGNRLRAILLRRSAGAEKGFGAASEAAGESAALDPAAALIEEATAEVAMAAAAAALKGAAMVGIGSPRASVETNFALRELVGAANFFVAVPDDRLAAQRSMAQVLVEGSARSASVKEASLADAVFVLGEDAWASAPILGLALRQASRRAPEAQAMAEKRIPPWDDAALREAVQDEVGPFFVAAPGPTGLDRFARELYRAAPDDIARLGFAVAHEIDESAPPVSGLPEEKRALASRIAHSLLGARQSLVVSGSSLGNQAIIEASANILRALAAKGKSPLVSFVFPEANSLGALLLARGGIESASLRLRELSPAALVVAEADLGRSVGKEAAAGMFATAAARIVVDHVSSGTSSAADIVLPSAPLFEGSGTLVSSEGRAQRFFAVHKSAAPIRDAWRWLGELAFACGKRAAPWSKLDELIAAIEASVPALSGIAAAAPDADFRVGGMRVPRGSPRESGRTARYANLNVREQPPPPDADSPLSFSMEGLSGEPPFGLASRFWAPGWNSDQAVNKFQAEIEGTLHGGDSGRRLMEPKREPTGAYRDRMPPAFARRDGELFLVARMEVFGSEELSSLSPSVRARSPEPYLAMARADIERLGLTEGNSVHLNFRSPGAASAAVSLDLSLRVEEMPEGVAAIPLGIAPLPEASLPAWAVLKTGEAKK